MQVVSARVRHDKKIFPKMCCAGIQSGQTELYFKVHPVTNSLQKRNRTVKTFRLRVVIRELCQNDIVKH